MKVMIENCGEIIWARNLVTGEGLASTGYIKDGKQQNIIAVLESALSQAKGEVLCQDNTPDMRGDDSRRDADHDGG